MSTGAPQTAANPQPPKRARLRAGPRGRVRGWSCWPPWAAWEKRKQTTALRRVRYLRAVRTSEPPPTIAPLHIALLIVFIAACILLSGAVVALEWAHRHDIVRLLGRPHPRVEAGGPSACCSPRSEPCGNHSPRRRRRRGEKRKCPACRLRTTVCRQAAAGAVRLWPPEEGCTERSPEIAGSRCVRVRVLGRA